LIIDVIVAGCAVASFGTFFSMPWRLLAFPVAVGMIAHAARWRGSPSRGQMPQPARSSPACWSVSS